MKLTKVVNQWFLVKDDHENVQIGWMTQDRATGKYEQHHSKNIIGKDSSGRIITEDGTFKLGDRGPEVFKDISDEDVKTMRDIIANLNTIDPTLKPEDSLQP